MTVVCHFPNVNQKVLTGAGIKNWLDEKKVTSVKGQ